MNQRGSTCLHVCNHLFICTLFCSVMMLGIPLGCSDGPSENTPEPPDATLDLGLADTTFPDLRPTTPDVSNDPAHSRLVAASSTTNSGVASRVPIGSTSVNCPACQM